MTKIPKKTRKAERDENQMAFDIVAWAERTGRDPAAVLLGQKGGVARKRNLTKEQLHEIAIKGANARWGKHRKRSVVPKNGN